MVLTGVCLLMVFTKQDFDDDVKSRFFIAFRMTRVKFRMTTCNQDESEYSSVWVELRAKGYF